MTYGGLNITILYIVLVGMLLLFAWSTISQKPEMLSSAHPSIRATYWFFFSAWSIVLLDYIIRYEYDAILPTWKNILYAVIGNTASFCLLAASIAYLRGRKFVSDNAVIYIAISSFCVFLWSAIWWSLLIYPPSPLSVAFAISPDFVFAVAALNFADAGAGPAEKADCIRLRLLLGGYGRPTRELHLDHTTFEPIRE